MKRYKCLPALVVFLYLQVCAQPLKKPVQWEFSFELGAVNDRLQFDDPAGRLRHVKLGTSLWGCRLTLKPGQRLYASTGLLRKGYEFGFGLPQDSSVGISSSNIVLLFPLCIGYEVPVAKRFFISPVAGISPGYIVRGTINSVSYSGSTVQYDAVSGGSGNDFMFLLQAGISAGYRTRKNLSFSFGTNWYAGTAIVETYKLTYKTGNDPGRNAGIKDHGGFSNYFFRVGYGINRQ
jgi:hypothetical protein